ncbi:uncharacterized protein C8Q71DRAFT_101379 [Rhodofomes roseus]|uniref:Uncharacterized protein n=1 Tax=Rhodofomes roseus TaxID=34475 RepID=A0ABQ8KE11_9APHY|nr:uncharacterized protein C8Q71DRAFT_101379 [Rhodofomes roseus]KAH9835887.1 hypothetical protein C8Q71DRAFT_101379 [Rhodofomes roseus]
MAPTDTNTPLLSNTKRPLQRNSSKLGRSLSYISSALSLGSHVGGGNMSSTLKRTNTKLTPFERFMQIGRRNTDGTVQFPPSHWTEPADTASPAGASADGLAATQATAEPEQIAEAPDASEVEGPGGQADSEPAPEPSYLARKIQAMLATLPTPSQTQTPTTESPSASEQDPAHAPKLPLPAWIADSRLVSYMTSPQVMNGSAAKGRPSVWDMLDRLKSTSLSKSGPAASPSTDRSNALADGVASAPQDGRRADDDEHASVMLYAPLVPDDYSEVEIARSEVISMFDDQTTIHEHEPETKEEATLRERLASMWPSDGMRIGGHRLPAEQPRERRIWVPSNDKISLELRWWGYRIYLPPPVLNILDNKRIESTKRAALLTTALKWLMDHIPMAAVPLQVRPAMPLLKRIIPYMGYIGAFVAWSWDAIRAFDKGNGVTLTATWLLTFALIPGSWEDDMFPEVAPAHIPSAHPAGTSSAAANS